MADKSILISAVLPATPMPLFIHKWTKMCCPVNIQLDKTLFQNILNYDIESCYICTAEGIDDKHPDA